MRNSAIISTGGALNHGHSSHHTGTRRFERTRRENLLALGGLPLVGRAVLAALKAPSIDRVYVTSDDPEFSNAPLATGPRPSHGPTP